MPALVSGVLGALVLFAAGFVGGGLRTSAEPELVLGASYALAGLGLMGDLAGGVALGMKLLKD